MQCKTTRTLGKILGWGLAVAMLASVGVTQAAMIDFNLTEFTGDDSAIRIELDDNTAGVITVEAEVIQPPIGDIRGIFFDLIDDPGLTVDDISGPNVTDVEANTNDLGNGVNVRPEEPFDFGVEFGTPGIGTDDLQSVTFLIEDLGGALTLADFGTFAGRLTSVGPNREGSSKLIGTPPEPTPVPAPAMLLLFAAMFGMTGLIGTRRRRGS